MMRVLDLIFFIYFATHIPISIFMDFQSVLPTYVYPQSLIDLKIWYCQKFQDPLMMFPPRWFQSLVSCEIVFQLPFFFVAAYGFFKGAKKCQWLRIPVIVYGVHVATTLVPILCHVLFHDFTGDKTLGPKSFEDRVFLASIYSPYFFIPVLLVVDAIFSSAYVQNCKPKTQRDNDKERESTLTWLPLN